MSVRPVRGCVCKQRLCLVGQLVKICTCASCSTSKAASASLSLRDKVVPYKLAKIWCSAAAGASCLLARCKHTMLFPSRSAGWEAHLLLGELLDERGGQRLVIAQRRRGAVRHGEHHVLRCRWCRCCAHCYALRCLHSHLAHVPAHQQWYSVSCQLHCMGLHVEHKGLSAGVSATCMATTCVAFTNTLRASLPKCRSSSPQQRVLQPAVHSPASEQAKERSVQCTLRAVVRLEDSLTHQMACCRAVAA